MNLIRRNDGFTLVELSSGLTAGVILLLAFSTLMVFSRQQTSDASERIGALLDGWMLDRYIRNTLSETVGDSVKIYADASAEQSGTQSSTGTILKTVDRSGNSYRIAVSNQRLEWEVNGSARYPVDAGVTGLTFERSSSRYGESVSLGAAILTSQDTLTYDWVITFRN